MGRIIKKKKSSENFLKLISFHSSYRPFIFISVLLILALIPIKVIEGGPNLSVCSRIFGDYCYSVGITRGVSSLLKGDVSLALKYNWLSIPVLGIMVFLIFWDLRKRF
jgi:hypothetical protein